MATQEIYIRNATETEARGPFSVPQVSDLAEAGQVTGETLIYDATTEQWVALESNPELMAAVFPEKKKLALKQKEIKALNVSTEGTKPITVTEMLAAAEGRTDDTSDKTDPAIAMGRAARIGMIGAMLTLIAAASAEILPDTAVFNDFTSAKLLAAPLVVLGLVDVVLAVLLALGMTILYPLIRFRAALGLGLMGFIYYAQGETTPLLLAIAGSLGLYLCTVFVHLIPALLAVAAGVGGMGMLAWHFISH
jgi:hypothetical protein